MNKRNIQKSELDAMGVKLLKTARLSGEEIDGIVTAPGLFESVMTAVAGIEEDRAPRRGWLSWKPAAVAAGFAALLLSTVYFGFLNQPETVAVVPEPKVVPPVFTVVSDESTQDFSEFAAEREKRPEIRPVRTATASRADYKDEAKPAASAPPKIKPAPEKVEREFHALNFAGNVEEAVRGGHVVRVDMPRSTLFALGVNLPLENDSDFVKTDVLVGRDGVPRAIRFVE